MKTALAFVCSLMLALTNIVLAQAPDASVAGAAHPCCHCGNTKSCCAAHHSIPEPTPVSAAPVSSLQTQFSPHAATVLAWTLPDAVAGELSSPLLSPFSTASAALFVQNCAWLI
jgi:hypothetical protein